MTNASHDNLRDALQRTLGDGFRIDRELGGGGMSRVFLATDLGLDRQVVVKVLSPELSEGVSADRFRREIQLIAKLQHPHIVPVLSAGSAEGALYYVMPFIAGESVRSLLDASSALPIPRTIRILREALDALSFAHQHGIVHRDIKPDNILIGAGHAVVADFGISKALHESGVAAGTLTSIGVAIGTPAYMAPEQAAADPSIDHRADIYAIGMVGYEMLAGGPPFRGTPSQLLAAQLTQTPTPLRERRGDIPVELESLILQALAKDPAARPQSAAEMIATLERIEATSQFGELTRPILSNAAATVATPRKRLVAMVTTALLIAVVAVAGVMYARRPTVLASAQSLAIVPFAVADGDTALVRLGQNLVTTMSANLDGVGDIRTADPMAVLSHAQGSGSRLTLAQALEIAKTLSAKSVVYGTLTRTGNSVTAAMSLYDLASPDKPVARVPATVSVDSISALTDSLTWGLLREIWSKGRAPTPNASSIATRSPVALREFLEGERLFARGGAEEAAAAYVRAIKADTSFWFAHWRYRVAREWYSQPLDTAITRRLSRHINDLPERERLLLFAIDSSSSIPERVSGVEAVIARFPDYVPALLSYGDYFVHHAVRAGYDIGNAIAPFKRLSELVPTDLEVAGHLTILYGATADLANMRRAALHFDSLVKADPHALAFPKFESAMYAMIANAPTPAFIDSMDRVAARDSMYHRLPAFMITLLAKSIAENPRVLIGQDSLLERYHRRSRLLPEGQTVESDVLLQMLRGDVKAIDTLRPDARVSIAANRLTMLRLRVLLELQGLLTPSPATAAQAIAATANADLSRTDRAEFQWIAGMNALMRGDSVTYRAQVAKLVSDTSAVSGVTVRSLRGIALGRSGNTQAAAESLLVLERMHWTVRRANVWSALGADRLLVSQWLTEQQRYATADTLMRFAEGFSLGGASEIAEALLPAVLLQRSRIAEGMGDKQLAARYAQGFLVVFDKAPESAKAQIDEAKARLARMGGVDAAKVQRVR